MNRLPPDKQEALKAMLSAGGSLRMARKKFDIAKNTALRYRKMLATAGIFCQCGQSSGHKGMCPFRYMSDGYQMRREFMKKWTGSKDYHCIDCGKARSGIGGSAGLRCKDCYKKQVKARAYMWAAEKRECKICAKENHRTPEGVLPVACETEWCQRLYAFYYVEGRSRPPSVQDGKNKGLRFELLLSDYLRRYANEKLGTKYRRTA